MVQHRGGPPRPVAPSGADPSPMGRTLHFRERVQIEFHSPFPLETVFVGLV